MSSTPNCLSVLYKKYNYIYLLYYIVYIGTSYIRQIILLSTIVSILSYNEYDGLRHFKIVPTRLHTIYSLY